MENVGHDANVATSPAVEATPQSHQPLTTEDGIVINVLPQEDLSQCHFWLGVFQRGTLSPAVLLDAPDIPAVFMRAATEGLLEDKAIMLSDSSRPDPRFFYLAPAPQNWDDGDDWVYAVARTVADLKVTQLGIYLAPELIVKEQAQNLLHGLLGRLVQIATIKEYHLYPGGHGSNQILNTALTIKKNLENDSARIFVFH